MIIQPSYLDEFPPPDEAVAEGGGRVVPGPDPGVQHAPAVPAVDDEWRAHTRFAWVYRLLPSGKKLLCQTITAGLSNVVAAIKYRKQFKNLFRYDDFSHEIKIVSQPPWDMSANFHQHRVEDVDEDNLQSALNFQGYAVNSQMVQQAISIAAHENRIHPAREWMNALAWDGQARLSTTLSYYFGCEAPEEPPEYLSEIFTKWLVGSVNRIMVPGCQMDYILILNGGQGAKKTSAFKAMATINGESYYGAIEIDKISNRDTILMSNGKLILELPDMAGLGKQDTRVFKNWITTDTGEGRMAFHRNNKRFPRQFIIGASDNPFLGWMDDPTGNRRFWPCTVGRMIDLESLVRDMPQLWAEAVHLYRSGVRPFLSPEMEKIADTVRENFEAVHPWDSILAKRFGTFDIVDSDDIYLFLEIPRSQLGRKEMTQVGKSMKKAGYDYIKGSNPHWRRRKMQTEIDFNEGEKA